MLAVIEALLVAVGVSVVERHIVCAPIAVTIGVRIRGLRARLRAARCDRGAVATPSALVAPRHAEDGMSGAAATECRSAALRAALSRSSPALGVNAGRSQNHGQYN